MNLSSNPRSRDLLSLLGHLPALDRPISCRKLGEEEREEYVLEWLVLDLNGIEDVPAFFTRPRKTDGPMPAILFNHSHGGKFTLGKRELVEGNTYLQKPPYAEALAARGIGALCIDAWAFGQRACRTQTSIFKEMLWRGRILWGMMVYDSLRAMDYLVGRPDVDSSRIGTLGMSMGSTMAWWTAALDERIRVCVDICCLTEFRALIETGGLDEHGVYYYVPDLLNHFSTAQINALIAPRPHLAVAGDRDPLTPVEGLERIDDLLKAAYTAAHASDAWKLLRYDVDHNETPDMRTEILRFLDRWL